MHCPELSREQDILVQEDKKNVNIELYTLRRSLESILMDTMYNNGYLVTGGY